MAYTPINWQTGDTITADKLNKMDNGWGVESTQLFSETVTVVGTGSGDNVAGLTYSQLIDADTITVTFDGTGYTCPRIDAGAAHVYGGFNNGPDFTECPFFIWSNSRANKLITQTAGEHTVTASTSTMQTSADFDKARGYGYVTGSPTELFSETVTTSASGISTYRAVLAYSQPIDANTITVTFDGTEYTCPRNDTADAHVYGGYSEQGPPVFTEYPFVINSTVDGNIVLTETASTHTVSAVAPVTSMQTSEDFRKAIGNPSAFEISLGVTTFNEAKEAFLSGKMVYVLDATSTDAYQCQVIYVDISRHTMSALEANGVNVNLRTFSASSANGVLNS